MDFEKDHFEDDNELSRLEDDEEIGGDAEEIVRFRSGKSDTDLDALRLQLIGLGDA